MGGFTLVVTKHPNGVFTLEVHNLFRYTGLTTVATSFADVLDSAIMELGLSVHEVGTVKISVSAEEHLNLDEEPHGKFFSGYLVLENEGKESERSYVNTRCWSI